MITLNDYLYNGDTVIKILHKYTDDLKAYAMDSGNYIDMLHCDFLTQLYELLEHNDFLTSQSQRMREFYKYMTVMYPDLAFAFKGRIKSVIRAESKFNGQIVSYIYDYHKVYGGYPTAAQIEERLSALKDLIAYRIIISLPKCHAKDEADRKMRELRYLYDIANKLPEFLRERGFDAQIVRSGFGSFVSHNSCKSMLDVDIRPYYKDYIVDKSLSGYQSLHITLFDNISRCYVEVQLRTYDMDSYAEIGPANHMGYENRQHQERARRDEIPVGKCLYFDDAYERVMKLQQLKLNELDVNMFAAADNSMINDACGLFRGRLILPYEHLSRFQND